MRSSPIKRSSRERVQLKCHQAGTPLSERVLFFGSFDFISNQAELTQLDKSCLQRSRELPQLPAQSLGVSSIPGLGANLLT